MDPVLDEFSQRVRDAAAQGTTLRIRGSGSKDFYGERFEGEPLDTRSYAGIVSYEPSELVVTVRAGTPLSQLEAELASSGQCLPFEPPRFGGHATVGGMVAAGFAGPARASVGTVRDYLLGASFISGRGDLLSFGGQVMKNVAGYDVSRLMAGSLGVLGLLVEVSLKVLPVTAAEATLKFEMDQQRALDSVNRWAGQPLPLNASCWVQDQGVSVLYVRLRGAAAAVAAACKVMGGERMDTDRAAHDWNACRDHELPWFQRDAENDLWRMSVPQTAAVLDLPEAPLVEWHGAQRWVRAPRGEAQRLRAMAQQAGGHATLFRLGSSTEPAPDRLHPLAPALQRIHRELKREFDPAGILNRGRMYAQF